MNESSANSSGNSPLVSIVMPAYNAEQFLREAVGSILAQTFGDFELIIINDGSTDGTAGILASLTDQRVRVIVHPSNQGLPKSLNDGVRASLGRFIARLDADDIAEPDRLKRQIAYLESHPDIGIIGSRARIIEENGNPRRILWRPRSPTAVKFLALFETPLLHPTVMARANILRAHPYDESYSRSEDYDLFSRLLLDYGISAANLAEPLTRLRHHQKGFTRTAGARGLEFVVGVTVRNMSRFRTLTGREREVVVLYRTGTPMRGRDVAAFTFLVIRLTVTFWRRERPPIGDAPGLARIALGTVWRRIVR